MSYTDIDQIYATNDQEQMSLLDRKAHRMHSVYKRRSTDYRMEETDTAIDEDEI